MWGAGGGSGGPGRVSVRYLCDHVHGNIIPQMSKKMTVIMDAQRSRGVETGKATCLWRQGIFPTIGP